MNRRRKILTALPAALVLTVPSAARAGDLASAERVALEQYPAAAKACPTITVETGTLINVGHPAEAYPDRCAIRFAPGVIDGWDQPPLCSLVVHEVGHLAGLGHTTIPGDWMNGDYLAARPECGWPAPTTTTSTATTIAVGSDDHRVNVEIAASRVDDARDWLRDARDHLRHARSRGARRHWQRVVAHRTRTLRRAIARLNAIR